MRSNMPMQAKYWLRVSSTDLSTEGSRLMRILLLWFFKKVHKFALCEFMPYTLGYFISLVQFFCPIWQMRSVAKVEIILEQR